MVFQPIAGPPGVLPLPLKSNFGIRYDQDHVGRLMHKFGLRERLFRILANRIRLPPYRNCLRRRRLKRGRRRRNEIRSQTGSRYSPNALRSASEISPVVAEASAAARIRGIRFAVPRAAVSSVGEACPPAFCVSRCPSSRRLSICIRSFCGLTRKTGTLRRAHPSETGLPRQ